MWFTWYSVFTAGRLSDLPSGLCPHDAYAVWTGCRKSYFSPGGRQFPSRKSRGFLFWQSVHSKDSWLGWKSACHSGPPHLPSWVFASLLGTFVTPVISPTFNLGLAPAVTGNFQSFGVFCFAGWIQPDFNLWVHGYVHVCVTRRSVPASETGAHHW